MKSFRICFALILDVRPYQKVSVTLYKTFALNTKSASTYSNRIRTVFGFAHTKTYHSLIKSNNDLNKFDVSRWYSASHLQSYSHNKRINLNAKRIDNVKKQKKRCSYYREDSGKNIRCKQTSHDFYVRNESEIHENDNNLW